MLTFKHTQIFGVDRALIASGNAMSAGEIDTRRQRTAHDFQRGQTLGKTAPGSAHDHYLCGVIVTVDIKYPLYIAPELQRYHWFEIITSQSTMHRLTAHLTEDCFNQYVTAWNKLHMRFLLWQYHRNQCYETMMRLRSNLPWGFEMWMTVTTNYLQLKTMYLQRKHHRLKEDWGAFCAWCLTLPSFELLTGVNDTHEK